MFEYVWTKMKKKTLSQTYDIPEAHSSGTSQGADEHITSDHTITVGKSIGGQWLQVKWDFAWKRKVIVGISGFSVMVVLFGGKNIPSNNLWSFI